MSILHAARQAYQAGLAVLPVKEDGTKAPDTSWREYQQTRPDPDQMRAWDFGSRAGFGIVAGPVSGHRETWDFDCRETFTAFLAAAESVDLGDEVRRIRTGYEDVTPSGGVRWIATYPDTVEWKDQTLARRPGRDGEKKIVTLVEMTQFAILAPSCGSVHESGKPYTRRFGGFDSIASYSSADKREALLQLARTFDQMPRPAPRESVPASTGSGDRPGDDYNRRQTWPALLEPAGWTQVFTRGSTTYWRRPGKDFGISATTNHADSDLLWVFSSSTVFDPDVSFTKFGAFATLHHGGDHSRAALALSRTGYGDTDADATEREDVRAREAAAAPAAIATGVSWRYLRDVKREYVDWLWRGQLARGTLTLWIGDGGLGKSRASNDIAARVTTAGLWPDTGSAPLGSVIILSAEDSPSYTIRPAIEAAGGDLARVAIIDAVLDEHGTERTFQLATDLAALEQVLDATQALLVVIDPLSAYFGTKLDSYRDTDVRAVLEPIVKLAERRRLAVLGIMHVGKGTDRQARHRALGSVAFVNAARLVFAIGPDPNDPDRRLLVPVKANLCREAPTLAFRLEDADGIARVAWEDAPVADVTAEAVLNGRPAAEDDDAIGAADLLQQLLEDEAWPLPASSIEAAGRAHGIQVRSLRRAAHKLGITIKKASFKGGWLWFQPAAEGDTRQGDTLSPSKTSSKVPTAKTTQPPRGHEEVSVADVSPSNDLSPSDATKRTDVRFASSSNIQQNTRRGEEDSGMSTRAREDDEPLPAFVTEHDSAPLAPDDEQFADRDED